MTVLSLVGRRACEHIGEGAGGVAYGRIGNMRLLSRYQPIFAAGRRGSLKLNALAASFLCLKGSEPVEADDPALLELAAPLALRNFCRTAGDDIDLYMDRSVVWMWDPSALEDCLADAQSLLLPRRVFLENGPELPSHWQARGRFRKALVHDQTDEQLDLWVAMQRPSIVRLEGEWVERLSRHEATRTLLRTLVGLLRQRGIKTLFDGLDDERLLNFAMDCGADLVQGDALAPSVLAGEPVDVRISRPPGNVIAVNFARNLRAP